MKYNQNYTYQNIDGVGRNCDDRWDVISKFITKKNSLVLDVGSAEGFFSKKIINVYDSKVISIEGSDFVLGEQKNYCKYEIDNGLLDLHNIELNKETLDKFLDKKYDYTLLLSVLHWCDEPDYILKKLSDISDTLFVELPDLNDKKSYGQEYLQRIKNNFGNLENYLQEISEKPIIGAYKVEGNNSEFRTIYILKKEKQLDLVDISDVYHLIHGPEEKIEYTYLNSSFKLIPIQYSPVISYLNGDIESYRNQPKLFYKREDSINYLIDEYKKGDINWPLKAVFYKGKYIICDGMHRSSILYKNGYRKLFIEVVSGINEKTATFEKYIKYLPQEKRDINKLSINDLYDIFQNFQLPEKKRIESERKEAKKTRKGFEHVGGEIIHQGPKWTMIRISDKGAKGKEAAIW